MCVRVCVCVCVCVRACVGSRLCLFCVPMCVCAYACVCGGGRACFCAVSCCLSALSFCTDFPEHVLIMRAVYRPTSICESIPTELISLAHPLPYGGVLCLPFAFTDIVVMNRCRVWPDHI